MNNLSENSPQTNEINQKDNNENESVEQVITLIKKNGIWYMEMYKDEQYKFAEGKELVVALMDSQNPIAATFVDGEILDTQYNSLYLKFNTDKEFEDHNCFNSKNDDIINILNSEDGLILALSPNHMPRTEKFNEYLEKNNVQLDINPPK